MEDPQTLTQTMEKVIRSSTINSNASNTKELHYLLRMLAPAACRSPNLFADVSRDILRVDFNLLKKHIDGQDEDKRLLLKSLPAKPTTTNTTTPLHDVSKSVICDLLNFLVRVPPPGIKIFNTSINIFLKRHFYVDIFTKLIMMIIGIFHDAS